MLAVSAPRQAVITSPVAAPSHCICCHNSGLISAGQASEKTRRRPVSSRLATGVRTTAARNDLELDLDLDLDIPEISEDLADYQREAGAVFQEGLSVPLHYGNEGEAFRAARESVVLVDRSHWGRLRLYGDGRVPFLQGQSTADISNLIPGQVCDTVLVNAQARCLDLVTCFVQERGISLVVSPGMMERLQSLLETRIFPADKVELTDISHDTALFSLIGPGSNEVMEKLGAGRALEPAKGELNRHMLLSCKGSPMLVAQGCGLPQPGITLMVDASAAGELWSALTSEGAVPMGEQGWQQLRVKAGRPAAGAELTGDWTPLEAGLAGAVSLAKGCYVGQETLAKVHRLEATRYALWGLQMSSPQPTGSPIHAGGSKVGTLTSCVQLPNSRTIGLGYVRTRGKGIQEGSKLEGLEVEICGEPATVSYIPAAQYIIPAEQLPKKEAEPTQQLGPAGESPGEVSADMAKQERVKAMQERLAAWQAQQQS